MDAGDGSLFSAAPFDAMGRGLLSNSREALNANLSVSVEGARAVMNGLRAVCEESGEFLAERVRRQTEFAEGLTNCFVPTALFAHIADYWQSEIRAWDAEQSKVLGLFAKALTDTMMEANASKMTFPKVW